ncbi:MAG: hypothetical protein HY956_08760 [Deltaproteobacteria bacterium]|nr:hypothetical protein [Deltaproteobacteria bacterium]
MLIKTMLALAAVLIFTSHVSAVEMKERSAGIEATLKVAPEKSMVDLFLKDYSKALKQIKSAKVKAAVKTPDGKTIEKELIGMEMEGVFSYMNSLDLSKKGGYIFDIAVDVDGVKRGFSFRYENR